MDLDVFHSKGTAWSPLCTFEQAASAPPINLSADRKPTAVIVDSGTSSAFYYDSNALLEVYRKLAVAVKGSIHRQAFREWGHAITFEPSSSVRIAILQPYLAALVRASAVVETSMQSRGLLPNSDTQSSIAASEPMFIEAWPESSSDASVTDPDATGWENARDAIRQYARYKRDWDGEGGSPPSSELTTNAVVLAKDLQNKGVKSPKDLVYYGDGEFEMHWTHGEAFSSVSLFEDGSVVAITRKSSRPDFSWEGQLSALDVASLADHIKNL